MNIQSLPHVTGEQPFRDHLLSRTLMYYKISDLGDLSSDCADSLPQVSPLIGLLFQDIPQEQLYQPEELSVLGDLNGHFWTIFQVELYWFQEFYVSADINND